MITKVMNERQIDQQYPSNTTIISTDKYALRSVNDGTEGITQEPPMGDS